MDAPNGAAGMIDWGEDGQPRSRLYGDRYFSRDGGLAEARAVFLAGCGLPGAWLGRRRFCVAELGFGTGLNIAALLDLWRETREPGAQLTIFSIEAHPLTTSEAAQALAAWPRIGDAAKLLIGRWPGRARGFHRIDLPEVGARLDLAVMEVATALRDWSGPADAWFLDGFAPALNPAMWRPEVLELIAARSAPNARLATYSVAGSVRRSLAAAGFTVHRRPGFGAKRERLEARLAGEPPFEAPTPRVAVIGAGIAGASLARAFLAMGVQARVFDAETSGSGASGAPAALVAPRLDAGLGPAAALFAQAIRRAGALCQAAPGAVVAHGARQRAVGPKDAARFAAIAGSDLFEPGSMRLLDGDSPSLMIDTALVVEPAVVLAAWLGDVVSARIGAIERIGKAWRLLDSAGRTVFEADIVCIAAAMGSADLVGGVDLTAVRGQASWAPGVEAPAAMLFGGYLLPTRDGVMFGATHDRGDTGADERPADHARNLTGLRAALPDVAARLEGKTLRAWAGVRATTSDYLPLAGAAAGDQRGLYLLTGLGSRGFCLAPQLAEHVAAQALGVPSPLPRALAALVEPARFAMRARRRGRPPSTSPAK